MRARNIIFFNIHSILNVQLIWDGSLILGLQYYIPVSYLRVRVCARGRAGVGVRAWACTHFFQPIEHLHFPPSQA